MDRSPSEVRQELVMACHYYDRARIIQLFGNEHLGPDDATGVLKNTLVGLHPTLVRFLLDNGADISVIGIRSIPSAEEAKELLKVFAEYGYDFKPDGHRILQDFADDRETLDWLLDQGVDINQTDPQRLDDGFNLARGETENSLHLLNNVAAAGDIDLFDHLVSRGADPSLSTALHAASRCKDPDMCRAMIRHLLDKHDMDVHRDNDDFRDFFHDPHDRGSPLCHAIIHENLAAVHEMLNRGASPNDPYAYPVSYAVKRGGFLPALEPLLRAGADPARSLKQAVHHRNLDAVKICLAHGVDPAPALYVAIEREEERVRDAADDAAYVDSLPVPDRGYIFREELATERKNKAMIALLSGEADSDDAA